MRKRDPDKGLFCFRTTKDQFNEPKYIFNEINHFPRDHSETTLPIVVIKDLKNGSYRTTKGNDMIFIIKLKMKLNEQLNRMKNLMGINESKENALYEYFLDAENIEEKTANDASISTSFSVDELVAIRSFKSRIAYCNRNLKLLGAGSSRRVYELPDGLNVVKLASNKKGIAQNEAEIRIGGDSYGYGIVAELKYQDNVDDYPVFIIMEKAVRIKEAEFKKLTNIEFSELSALALNSHGKSDNFINGIYKLVNAEETEEAIQFANDLNDYIAGTGLSFLGDLGKIDSYGKVIREGHETIVLVDYGLTNSVGANYYGM